MALTGTQLGQLRPTNTTAASVYSPAASTTGIVRYFTVCNTSGAAAAFRLFHDLDGTTYDETTALFWDVNVPADTTVSEMVHIFADNSSGNIAFRTDTNDALTCTLYGYEKTY